MGGLKKTESTLNLQDRKVPFWDSSDPSRNPAPMPLYPDSPNLNHTPNGSPTKFSSAMNAFGGSPIRQQPFGSRISTHNDDKLNELLDLTKEIHRENGGVKDSVKEALIEFGSLAYRSRDNGTALGQLQEKAKKTEETGLALKSILEDGMFKLVSSMENQKESQNALSLIVDSLLDSSRDVVDNLSRNEEYLRELTKVNKINHSSMNNNDQLEKIMKQGHMDTRQSIEDLFANINSHHNELLKLITVVQQELLKTSKDTTKLLFQAEESSKGLVSAATNAVKTAVEAAKSSKYDANQLEKTRQQTIDIQNVVKSIQRDLQRLTNDLHDLPRTNNPQLGKIEDKLERVENVVKSQYVDLIQDVNEILNKNKNSGSNVEKAEVLHDIQQHHDFLFQKVESKLDKHNQLRTIDNEKNYDRFSKATRELLANHQSHNENLIGKIQEMYLLFDKKVSLIQDQNKSRDILLNEHKDISKTLLDKNQLLIDNITSTKDIAGEVNNKQNSLKDLITKEVSIIAEKINLQNESFDKHGSFLNKINDNEIEIIKRIEDVKNSSNSNDSVTILQGLVEELKESINLDNLTTSVENKLESFNKENSSNLQSQFKSMTQYSQDVNDKLIEFNKRNEETTEKNYQLLKSILDESSVKYEQSINNNFSEHHKYISKLVVDQIKLENGGSNLSNELKAINSTIQSLASKDDSAKELSLERLIKDVQYLTASKDQSETKLSKIEENSTNLKSLQNDLSTKINGISGDVQSLVDFQYGDTMTALRDNISFIVSNLTSNQQEKVKEYQFKLQEAQQEISELKSKFSIFKYHDKGINEQEVLQEQLKSEVEDLRNEKLELSKQIERLKVEMEMKFDHFTQLEQRIETFEERLNNTILERSKGILGSTTLAMINNGGGNTSPLKTSSSKRNLSLVPDRIEERDGSVSPTPLGKENELNIVKRGSPFVKGRSVSLFVDH